MKARAKMVIASFKRAERSFGEEWDVGINQVIKRK
jgi:hypothetical protein